MARSASDDEVRKAFRKLAKQLHPDKNPGDKAAEDRFKRISAAFDIVGDPEKRKKFDRGEIDADGREGHPAFRGGGNPFSGGGNPFSGGRGRGGPEGFEGVNFDDILGEMFGARGGAGGPGGGMGGGRGFASKGSDVRAKLEIDLEDAISGALRRITFGDGKTLDVQVPKGAAEGQTLRLRGQGHSGRGGGPNGDVLIELAIKPHPIYRREGANLYMDLPVSVPDAVLGAKVSAPTPEGAVTLTVPKGSNSGATLRLKGRGGVDEAGKRGDLFARLMVTLPDEPDSELIRFAETWRVKRPYAPKPRDG